jgi:hypothetical protein
MKKELRIWEVETCLGCPKSVIQNGILYCALGPYQSLKRINIISLIKHYEFPS